MAKQKKYGESEYKTTRLIVSICFIALIVFYVIYLAVDGGATALVSSIIIFIMGVLLCIFCYTIYQQKKKVQLGYDDMVVCKICGVCGVLLILVSIVVLVTQVLF